MINTLTWLLQTEGVSGDDAEEALTGSYAPRYGYLLWVSNKLCSSRDLQNLSNSEQFPKLGSGILAHDPTSLVRACPRGDSRRVVQHA